MKPSLGRLPSFRGLVSSSYFRGSGLKLCIHSIFYEHVRFLLLTLEEVIETGFN
ncbi:hypothetical protein LEP1GSC170_6035 [Leptospira interrogans serovar Bataviae str. HAI135]|nr:hypothetical protein LEP1GSC170_6035 [Leptospira interrogans serovar Bataviae str. HAI135]